MIRTSQIGPAAWIVINRPEARNAISAELARAIVAHIAGASARDDVRAIVLTGAGDTFSLRALGTTGEAESMERAMTFAFREVRVGVIPAMISPFVQRRIGAARMQRLFITGESLDCREAVQIGLIDYLADPDRLDDAVTQVVSNMASEEGLSESLLGTMSLSLGPLTLDS